MRINAWYQLPDGDNEGRFWHAADIGEWSLTVGGAGCRSVVDSLLPGRPFMFKDGER